MGSTPGWRTKVPHAVCPINKIIIKKFLFPENSNIQFLIWQSPSIKLKPYLF